MNIYKSGAGDELVNSANYNKEILLYLRDEAITLSKIISNFETVVEAGCMSGRNLEIITSLQKNYLGVDIEKRYIEEANAIHATSEKIMFANDDIINLENLLKGTNYSLRNMVVVFPFNSFGNVMDNFGTLISMLDSKFNIAIFTYKNDRFTNEIRENYYRKSGFNKLSIEKNMNGIRFFDEDGLNSKAFSKDWFLKQFLLKNQKMRMQEFSNIGVLYTNFDIY